MGLSWASLRVSGLLLAKGESVRAFLHVSNVM